MVADRSRKRLRRSGRNTCCTSFLYYRTLWGQSLLRRMEKLGYSPTHNCFWWRLVIFKDMWKRGQCHGRRNRRCKHCCMGGEHKYCWARFSWRRRAQKPSSVKGILNSYESRGISIEIWIVDVFEENSSIVVFVTSSLPHSNQNIHPQQVFIPAAVGCCFRCVVSIKTLSNLLCNFNTTGLQF